MLRGLCRQRSLGAWQSGADRSAAIDSLSGIPSVLGE